MMMKQSAYNYVIIYAFVYTLTCDAHAAADILMHCDKFIFHTKRRRCVK